MKKLENSYDKRSNLSISNLLFSYRAWYYEKYIVPDILKLIEIQTNKTINILNRGFGQGHKFEKIIKLFNELDIEANFN
jgi:hypothetical protein